MDDGFLVDPIVRREMRQQDLHPGGFLLRNADFVNRLIPSTELKDPLPMHRVVHDLTGFFLDIVLPNRQGFLARLFHRPVRLPESTHTMLCELLWLSDCPYRVLHHAVPSYGFTLLFDSTFVNLDLSVHFEANGRSEIVIIAPSFMGMRTYCWKPRTIREMAHWINGFYEAAEEVTRCIQMRAPALPRVQPEVILI